jgi:hypothetical protein
MREERPLTVTGQTCGVCQFPIDADEERTRCPHCALPFHAECWEENYGCAAYGCPQVNALKPASPAGGAAGTGRQDGPKTAVPPPDPFPWDFLFLGVSALGALVGLVAFGAPCAVALVVAMVGRAFSKRKWLGGVFLLGVLVCLAGAAGGAVASYYLWIAAAAH